MQALDRLSREELIALVHDLQERLAARQGPGHSAAGDLDYIAGQALTVLDNSGIPALIFDTGGELRILAANGCLCALAGRQREEIERSAVTELLAPEDRGRLRRMLHLPRQGGFAAAGGWRVLTRAGEVREVEVSGYDLDFRGHSARFVIAQDVTLRRREQLVQQRLAAIVETSRDAILSCTADGTILSVNRAAERLFGYSAAEIVGRSIDVLLPAEIRDHEREFMRGRIAAGLPIDNYYTRRQHKDGTAIDVAISAAPLKDADGRIIGASSIVRDVRALKDAQRKLTESHERLRRLAELSYDWCWEQDENLRFTYHSAERDEHLDLVRHSILGRTLFELPVIWQSEQQKHEHSEKLGRREPFKDLEYRIRDPQGRERYVTVSGEPIFDEAGRFRGYRGIGRDVTARRSEESSLRLLSAIVDSTDEAIMSWSADGTLLTWNRAATAMLGYAPEEVVGKPVAMLLPAPVGDLKDPCSAALAGAHAVNAETVRRHKNGTIIPVAVTCSPILDDQGRVNAVACIARDVRPQRLQERLVADSHQRLKLALEAAKLSLWDWDVPAANVMYSDEFARMLGFSPGELPQDGELFEHLVHPDDAPVLRAAVAACLQGERALFECEFRARDRDGRWRWLATRGQLVARDRGGGPLRMTGTAQDVTGRHDGQPFDQMLAAVLDASDQVIFSHTLEGTVLTWNRAAERVLGWRAQEVVGRHCSMLMRADLAGEIDRIAGIARAGHGISRLETARRHRDGHDVRLWLTIAPLYGRDDEVTGVVAVGRELSERRESERVPKEAEARFRSLVEASAQAVWITNAQGEVDAAIPSWQRYTGLSFEQIRGQGWLQALHPDDRAHAARHWAQACSAGSVFDAEFRVRRHDGVWRHMHARAVPVRGEDGSIREWVGMSTDISSLRESERQLDSILNDAAEAVIVVSSEGSIERFNLAAQRLFGYSAEEARTLNLRQLTLELAFDEVTDAAVHPHATWIKPLLGGRREITGRRKDGTIFPLELSLSEIGMGGRPSRFTAVLRDITDRKSWENRIYTLAYTDSLTGLPNRLLLRDRLEHAIAAGQRNRSMVGVLFFDLDHFKAINDSYGHHAGDELLREIAKRTAGCVREIDTVCRLGGDEFVLVLPELHEPADAGAVARKLLAVLSQPYEIDGHELHITPTLGISIYPQDGADADTLVRNADTAMYHAKESGKNDYRYFNPRTARP